MNWTLPTSGRSAPARLVGGPYDGDLGLVPRLPVRLWVWSCTRGTCSVPGSKCPAGGIHWEDRYDDLPDGEQGAVYDLDQDGPDERGVYRYVYGELLDPSGVLREEALAEV